MALRHDFNLHVSENKLIIQFPAKRYENHSILKAAVALDAVLSLALHLKASDYEMKGKENETMSITIKDKVNIVYVLDYLLKNDEVKLKFSYQASEYEAQSIQKYHWLLTVDCLNNYKDSSLNDLKKTFPVMRSLLDFQFDLIMQDKFVKTLNLQANPKYGDDLFTHPFYQILRMLHEDFNSKLTTYNTKHGLFDKKPSDEKHKKVYARFIDYIPLCFCDVATYSNTKTLSAEKLKRAIIKDGPVDILERKASIGATL